MAESTEAGRPVLALTMGDPAGIGPEVCLRAMADPHVREACIPVLYGEPSLAEECARKLGLEDLLPRRIRAPMPGLREAAMVAVPATGLESFAPGRPDAATGRIAFACIDRAIEDALARRVAGVVTAPASKKALHEAGVRFPGHTEIFATRTKAESWCMMQYSRELACSFATVHVGYAEVPSRLSSERVLEVIRLTDRALARIHGREGMRLALCGLNPHAGEHGLFGRGEEERILVPAVEQAAREGFQVEGPLAPDSAFTPARRERTDGYICLYHDQGHIPIKALAFDRAVNLTLGLPIVRTSADHGTALDIAWKGEASPSSLCQALRLAARLATSR